VPCKCEFCEERLESDVALRKHLRLKHAEKVKLAVLEHPVGRKGKARRAG
jgi:hypothetical protein